jgi:hypothetical protein
LLTNDHSLYDHPHIEHQDIPHGTPKYGKMPRCEKGLAKLGFGFLGPALKFRGATKHLCL